jgi:hypothetical protein
MAVKLRPRWWKRLGAGCRGAFARYSAPVMPPNGSIARRSTAFNAPGCGWTSPARSSCTGNGCAAKDAAWTPASTCTVLEMFTGIGTEAFAGRAERELLATGEHARKRTVETREELTAQEAHVARLARDGLANPAVALLDAVVDQPRLEPAATRHNRHGRGILAVPCQAGDPRQP